MLDLFAIVFENDVKSLYHIRPYLGLEAAKSVSSSIIDSRLDYANGVIHGMPVRNLQRMQRVQDSLACVSKLLPSDSSIRSNTIFLRTLACRK